MKASCSSQKASTSASFSAGTDQTEWIVGEPLSVPNFSLYLAMAASLADAALSLSPVFSSICLALAAAADLAAAALSLTWCFSSNSCALAVTESLAWPAFSLMP